MARSYGLYLEEAGITDRATVIIDAGGIVRHVSSVTPSGKRNIEELAILCEEVNSSFEDTLTPFSPAPGVEDDTVMFVKSRCMFSTNALAALHNLGIQDLVTVRNVTQDSEAMDDLLALAGKKQAPCLVVAGKPLHESADIISYLAGRVSDLAT